MQEGGTKRPQDIRESAKTGTHPTGGVYRSKSQHGQYSWRRGAGSQTQPGLQGPNETVRAGTFTEHPKKGGQRPENRLLIEHKYTSQTVWGSEVPEGANQHTH